jgi:hypothetical protein
LVETGNKLLLEDANHDLLPEGKEDCNFNRQKFEKG